MIVKSLSRKSRTFARLLNYMEQEDKPLGQTILWNLSSDHLPEIVTDFEDNAGFLSPRKRGNVYYHEIISLPRGPNDCLKMLQNALYDAAHYWLKHRANDHLAYGRIHLETNTAHIHLMISANPLMTDRVSLSKAKFKRLQAECEAFIADRYPEINPSRVYDKTNRICQKSCQVDYVSQEIETVLLEPLTHISQSLPERLAAAGYTLYLRGKTSHGVICQNDGKKYRFKRLGLLDLFKQVLDEESKISASKAHLNRYAHRLQDHYRNDLEDWSDFLHPVYG